MRLLLVDDEKSIRLTLGDDLEDAGFEVVTASEGETAKEKLMNEHFDCLITDLKLPGVGGMKLLKIGREYNSDLAVIVITGYGTVESAVEAMKLGASDYILKPFINEEVILRLGNIKGLQHLRDENRRLKQELSAARSNDLIGKSPKMQEVLEVIKTISDSNSSVLIQGPSGTGKEVVANAIHRSSLRKDKPLIKMNCAIFAETLLEDELFGHEKGAFTDARSGKIGRFEQADGGTIFLDDIDDMPIKTQVKILRVLQERELERLGGSRTIKVDIRVIAATKVDLGLAVREGRFREDLYYRLNVVPIVLPPLNDRAEDIILLLQHFIKKYGHGAEYEVSEETLASMLRYSWPGNVRELENAVERAIALSGGSNTLKKQHLLLTRRHQKDTDPNALSAQTLKDIVIEAEITHIRRVLELVDGQKTKAADILGISRKNLWEKMREYGIS